MCLKTSVIRCAILFFSLFFGFSGSTNAETKLTVKLSNSTVKFNAYVVENLKPQLIENTKLNDSYSIRYSGKSQIINLQYKGWIPVYIANADEIEVSITDSTIEFLGSNAEINNKLWQWKQSLQWLIKYTANNFMNDDLLLAKVDSIAILSNTFSAALKTPSKEAFTEMVKCDLVAYCARTLSMLRSQPLKEAAMQKFTLSQYTNNFPTEISLYHYAYEDVFNMYYHSKNSAIEPRKHLFYDCSDNEFVVWINQLDNAEMKQSFAAWRMLSSRLVGDESVAEYNMFSPFLQEKNSKIEELYAQRFELKTGKKAIEFVASDVDDKEFSLNDFKGKLLFLDFWATWCVPCRREFPALKVIEEEFKNDNIAFVKISLDEDKKKWMDYIKAHNEELGISLRMEKGFDNEFCKHFLIRSVPRFILIDKNGNIVNASTPRPSESALKELIKANL